MSTAYRHSVILIFALLTFQVLWHGKWSPPTSAPPWLIVALFALPMLPVAVMAIQSRRRAPLWGAVVALFYFSHGLMEAWAEPDMRPLALAEAALSVALIVVASWDGLKARFNKKKNPSAL